MSVSEQEGGCPVVKAWLQMPELVSRGATGKIPHINRDGDLTRQTVIDNVDILEPLIREFGTRPSISQMQDVTSRFLYLCRPRGKPLPKSDVIKTEAWALRRLVSIFGGVTRRPHIPRDKQLRKLFSCVGIDVDQGSGPAEENDEHYDEGGECEESEAAWTDDECVEDQDLTDQHQPDIAAKDGGNEGSHKFVTKSIVSRESLSRGFSSESMVPSPSYTVTPPPRPRQSTESPLSAPKHHEPVKCGWICTTCKTAHRFKEKVMETPCFDEEKGHALVESPLMCNRCFTLSDSVRALSTKLCPSLHCEDDLVEKTVPQVVPKRPVPPVPKFEAKQVQENIQAAEKEMRRLKLLQMVHWERQRLAELVAKKNKGGIDNVDTLPMCDEEIQRLAGIEAFDTPQEYCTTDLNGNRVTSIMYPLPDWPIYVREGEICQMAKIALIRGHPPVIFLPSTSRQPHAYAETK
ncbi:unnamed protein product [Durusdinium trenchii]|uniref:Uncharacterized protein n=1 Tax=Durusdinium trenchii TaxID=1381693 RepID=A0ABP0S4U4_9DINO